MDDKKERGIRLAIVDHPSIGRIHSIGKHLLPNDIIVVAAPPREEYILEINGVKYRRAEEPKVGINRKLPSFADETGIAGMYHHEAMRDVQRYMSLLYGKSKTERALDKDIQIIQEFELIQNKKSKLSKWERDEVVRIFNKHFVAIE